MQVRVKRCGAGGSVYLRVPAAILYVHGYTLRSIGDTARVIDSRVADGKLIICYEVDMRDDGGASGAAGEGG